MTRFMSVDQTVDYLDDDDEFGEGEDPIHDEFIQIGMVAIISNNSWLIPELLVRYHRHYGVPANERPLDCRGYLS